MPRAREAHVLRGLRVDAVQGARAKVVVGYDDGTWRPWSPAIGFPAYPTMDAAIEAAGLTPYRLYLRRYDRENPNEAPYLRAFDRD